MQADFLKVYAVYCANHGRSLDTLQLLRKHNPAFAVFLQVRFRKSLARTTAWRRHNGSLYDLAARA